MGRKETERVYTFRNTVSILNGGRDYFDCLEELANTAKYTLQLQTYIFDDDETGSRVADSLKRAARRGVKVYLLVDGYASQRLSVKFITGLREAGVQFDFFEPLFRSRFFYIGRRLHHKVVVVDAIKGLVAGINISNRYNDIGNRAAWLDWALYVEGEVAEQLDNVCRKVWNGSLLREKCVVPDRVPFVTNGHCKVRVRRNDWVFTRTEITRSYRELLREATTKVTIMTSYFLPSWKMLRRIRGAVKRGVSVNLILAARTDVPVSKYAERYLYSWLFRNNIAVYEYQRNVLHGKIAVCDQEWFTVGSYNVNNISAYASVELNLDVRNRALATEIDQRLQHIIDQDCIHITEADFEKTNNVFKRVLYYLSFICIHIFFYLFTFYYIQRREKN